MILPVIRLFYKGLSLCIQVTGSQDPQSAFLSFFFLPVVRALRSTNFYFPLGVSIPLTPDEDGALTPPHTFNILATLG